MNKYKCKA